jgi:NAD(P)H-dependent FMN reductase
MKPHILVITSTVRQNRACRKVADWYIAEARKAVPEATFELLDIADYDIPVFSEPISPLMAEKYTPLQEKLAAPVRKADGYVIVTGEYNHSIPGSLKNFIDHLSPKDWRHKAVAYVGYGTAGGFMSINHLTFIMAYLGVASVLNTINISAIWEAFDEDGKVKPNNVHGDIKRQLDELLWWVNALKTARMSG